MVDRRNDIRGIFEDFQIDPYLLYDAIVKSTDDYIYIVDMKTDVSLVSENMMRDFALPGRLVNGLVPLWGELVHSRDRERYFDSIDQMLKGVTDEHNLEYQIRNHKGEYIWVICRGLLKRDETGAPAMFAGVVTNLGNRGKVDHITGLFMQSECEKLVEQLLETRKKEGGAADISRPGGILLLGLDNFVRINNLNNHIFGNTVLRQFAQTVQAFLPHDAEIFRFDGDTFAIVCRSAGKKELEELYQRIHAYSNRWHDADGIAYFCTVSAGIVLIGVDGDNYLNLVKYAESSLEESKRKGKNTCTFFCQELISSKLRMLELANQLQMSISNGMDRFHVVYQPLAGSDGHSIDGAEALLRWSCEPYGNVSPNEFIPVLESTGLIVTVGKWVFLQAVRACKKWTAYRPDFIMNINISYLQMLDDSFLAFVRDTLVECDLDPSHIVLEMTESYFVTDLNALKHTFHELRKSNIRIAMDDFGTGYSSMGLLSQSPADIVKIDRIFISSINDKDHEFNRSFIQAVINLCHSVGIEVCVEGVEHCEELQAVKDMEADSIQGFYISKPVTEDEFEKNIWGIDNN